MKDWKPFIFEHAVDCNPKVAIKVGEIVQNCEMEDIIPEYKFLYPQATKLYKGSNSKFQNGDTVFARITPCLENGKIAQIKDLEYNKGIGSTEFFVFRGKKDISDNDYIHYLVKTNLIRDTAVNSMSGASGRQRADLKALKKVPILLPSLEEQKKISSFLSAYDDLIEINTLRIKKLEEGADQIFREWFIRLRFPGYKEHKFEKNIPFGWENKKTKTILNRYKFGRTYKKEELDSYGDVKVFDQSTAPYIGYHNNDPDHLASTLEPLIIFGDHSCKIQLLLEPFSLGENVISLSASDNNQTYFVFHLINKLIETTEYKRHWNELISKFVLIPDEALQIKFSNLVMPMHEQINLLVKQNIELQQIRDCILPRLISGKSKITNSLFQDDENQTIPTTSIIEQPKKVNPYFKRTVLAAFIIDNLKDEITFGHVKLMKLMYLCEHLAEIETISNYHRDAAGPYDNRMMRSIDSQLKKSKWFECVKTDQRYYYKALEEKEDYKKWFTKYYSDKEIGILSLLNIFGKQKTIEAEKVATLYEAHRSLLEKNIQFTDDNVINEVLYNWHESKKRILPMEWKSCLNEMKRKGWVN